MELESPYLYINNIIIVVIDRVFYQFHQKQPKSELTVPVHIFPKSSLYFIQAISSKSLLWKACTILADKIIVMKGTYFASHFTPWRADSEN